jgi:phosphoglycerate dehydrogenase-like enzyme
MSKPKILIFAHARSRQRPSMRLKAWAVKSSSANRDWQLPRTTHEDAVVEPRAMQVALMGTSMRHTPISRRIMQASQRLRIVAKYTVGVDDIDTEAATDLGIMVCHAPTESNCFGVAETTITFMLSLLKKTAERDADVRAGKWRTAENFAYYVGSRSSDGFAGQTIGLVGLGRIGTRVAQLLAPWRARIIAYDPYVPPAHFLTHGVTAVDYETLLRESDVVSFHVVLTRETRYMFGEEQLKLMKPNAIVLNTARGRCSTKKPLPGRSTRGASAAPPSMPSKKSRCRWTRPCASSATGCCSRPTPRRTPKGRTPAGRGVGHAFGGHRTQGWHPRQCLQPGGHSTLEGAFWRGQRHWFLAALGRRDPTE